MWKFTSERLNLDDDAGGGKRAGRPPRGCDSRPGRRARANLLRHLLTTWRGVSKRAAMTSLERPSAASSTIFARITSQYGYVYWRACASGARRFCLASTIANGLSLGTKEQSS